MKRIITSIATTVFTVSIMSGCAGVEGEPTSDGLDSAKSESNAEPAGTNNDAKPERDAPPEPMVAAFGEVWTYEDGVTMSISKPQGYTPGQWSFGGEGYPHHVKFTVTITNGSKKPLDVSLFDATVTSNGRVGESDVVDEGNGVDMAPSTSVMPGQEISWTAGAGVQGLRNMGVTAAPNWDYAPAAFGQ